MNLSQAHTKWEKCLAVIEQLAHEFPCQDCEGTGDKNPRNHPYPEPCPECWGRGFQIPTTDKEEDE